MASGLRSKTDAIRPTTGNSHILRGASFQTLLLYSRVGSFRGCGRSVPGLASPWRGLRASWRCWRFVAKGFRGDCRATLFVRPSHPPSGRRAFSESHLVPAAASASPPKTPITQQRLPACQCRIANGRKLEACATCRQFKLAPTTPCGDAEALWVVWGRMRGRVAANFH